MIVSRYGTVSGKNDRAKCMNCHTRVILDDADYDKSFNGAKQWTCPLWSTKNIVNKYNYRLPDRSSINFDADMLGRIKDFFAGLFAGVLFTIISIYLL